MTINKEQPVSDVMLAAGLAAFKGAGRPGRLHLWDHELRAVYLAMKAASHPQQAVSDATKRMAKIMDCDFVPHDRMKRVEEAAPHPNLIERLNRSRGINAAACHEAAQAISTLTAALERAESFLRRMADGDSVIMAETVEAEVDAIVATLTKGSGS
jgi:hypothetical protein